MSRPTLNFAVAAALVLLLAGCATPGPGVSLEEPQELPATHPPIPVAPDWWTAYNDPALSTLVDEALRYNTDLARAMARIDEARAVVGLARSANGPVVSAGVTGNRQRFTENGRIPLGDFSPYANLFQATLDVSYEFDLWGRFASATDAARSELLASEYARDTIRIALAAQVVQSYAALRALDEQIVVYQRAVSAQREGLRLNRARFEAGDMSELDWRQLEAELLANETQLPRLARARVQSRRAPCWSNASRAQPPRRRRSSPAACRPGCHPTCWSVGPTCGRRKPHCAPPAPAWTSRAPPTCRPSPSPPAPAGRAPTCPICSTARRRSSPCSRRSRSRSGTPVRWTHSAT